MSDWPKKRRRRRNPTEDDHHLWTAEWLDAQGFTWLHVPNEGARSVVGNSKLLRMGMRKGASDFLVFAMPGDPWGPGIAAELKKQIPRPTRGKTLERWRALLARGHTAYTQNGRPFLLFVRGVGPMDSPPPLPPEPVDPKTGIVRPMSGWPSNAQVVFLERMAYMGRGAFVGWSYPAMLAGFRSLIYGKRPDEQPGVDVQRS